MNHKLCKNGHTTGPSSIHMQGVDDVFSMLNLSEGEVFLDLGCGAGDYSLEAVNHVGETGEVLAVDVSERFIYSLIKEGEYRRLDNLIPVVSDMTEAIDLISDSVDCCLISTVLHALDLETYGETVFDEVKRILKDEGRLFILECHGKRKGFGPPEHRRIPHEQLDEKMKIYGFKNIGYKNLGHNYLCEYRKESIHG